MEEMRPMGGAVAVPPAPSTIPCPKKKHTALKDTRKVKEELAAEVQGRDRGARRSREGAAAVCPPPTVVRRMPG